MLKYLLRVASGVRFKKLFETIDKVQEKSGQSRLYTFFDMLNCMLRYGAGYYDYLIFAYYDMNHAQRSTYVSRIKNKKLIMLLNDQSYSYIFENKGEFNRHFKKYLRREYLDIADITLEKFREFMKNKEIVFAKPYVGESGKGIEKLSVSDFESVDALYSYITDKNKNFGLIEELIVQHKDLTRLYPLSINTYRILTVVAGDKAHCVYVVSKMGNAGKYVDNMENSGLCCPVDIESGKINGIAHTSALINYDRHPYTGVELVGYKLPFVREAVEMCLDAAMQIKEMRYIGWDVCVMEDGPALIEGNDYPGYDFWQLPEHTPDKTGLLPYFKKLIPELK